MNQKFVPAVLATAVALACAAPAIAQDDELDESLIEEITVTAAKREQSIYEVPIAISAFEGDKLAEQGIIYINDIGKFVPNLTITEFSAGHTSSVNPFIRGIGLQDHLITTDPGVSVYVDGVYLGRQVGQNWNLANIERVEVLRGPQGTLYGRNSIGGAINIITKTPGSDPGARVGFEYGSRDRFNGDFYGDAQLNDTVAVSFSGGFNSRGGVGKFINLPNTGVEVGETQEIFGRLAFRFQFEDASITVVADQNDGEGGLRPYTTLIDEVPNGGLANAPPEFGGPYSNSDLPSNPYDNATLQANQTRVSNAASGVAVTVDWELSENLDTRLIASARQSDYKAGLDDDSLPVDYLSFPEFGEADQMSFEWQLLGDYDTWDFVSGLYYFEEDGENNQDPTVFLGGPGSFFLSQEVESLAAYANVGFNVSEAFRISGGLRYTGDRKDGETNVGIGLVTETERFDEISWELAANFTLGNGMTTYGAIQSGYQSGQFPARPFCLFVDPNCFNPSENITATNYEIGIKGQPLENLQISAAVFFTEYEDLPYQVSETTDAGFNTVNKIVDQESFGIEWESLWYITENFSLQASIGYIDVDVDKETPDDPVVAPLTPEITASVSPMLVVPTANGGDVTFRADWSFRDDMFGEPTSDPGRFTAIESREILNLNIAYNAPGGDWTLAAYGRNVANEKYDAARLNPGDYALRILNNDLSEYGVRVVKAFK